MSATLRFKTWFFYNGSPERGYARRWVFTGDYPQLDVTVGQLLYEDDGGFHIRDATGEAKSLPRPRGVAGRAGAGRDR